MQGPNIGSAMVQRGTYLLRLSCQQEAHHRSRVSQSVLASKNGLVVKRVSSDDDEV